MKFLLFLIFIGLAILIAINTYLIILARNHIYVHQVTAVFFVESVTMGILAGRTAFRGLGKTKWFK